MGAGRAPTGGDVEAGASCFGVTKCKIESAMLLLPASIQFISFAPILKVR